MAELIQIASASIGGAEVATINARDLHAFLEIGKDFSQWLKARIEQYGLVEGVDFVFAKSGGNSVGRPRLDYHLTLDTAKELAMVERNAKGKLARQYFIDCERRARAAVADVSGALSDPAQLRRALLGYTERVIELEGELAGARPKVEFHDAVVAEPDEYSMQDAAKILGTGGNRLFRLLRDRGVLRKNNLPYQKSINAGHFVVRITEYLQPDGIVVPRARTFVTSSGLVYLFRLLRGTPDAAAGGDAT